jgi:hypothetical protein
LNGEADAVALREVAPASSFIEARLGGGGDGGSSKGSSGSEGVSVGINGTIILQTSR